MTSVSVLLSSGNKMQPEKLYIVGESNENFLVPAIGPTWINYITQSAREKSFINNEDYNYNANYILAEKKELLARAGFFFNGKDGSNHVRCFYCGGALKKWLENDDPWVEHGQAFPDCSFLRLNMGINFINNCKILSQTYFSERQTKKYSDCIELAKQIEMEKNIRNNPNSEESIPKCLCCNIDEKNIAFIPCSHLYCCSLCAPSFISCPICRIQIRGYLRIINP